MGLSPITIAAMRLLQQGAWHEAEDAARQALADAGEEPHALLVLGLAVAAMGEAARAAPALNRVIALRPDATHPCAELASLQPPLPRALVARQFASCLRLDPGDQRLRLEYASFLLDNNEPDRAGAMLADGPDTAQRHHLAGLAHAESGRFRSAIGSFRRAVALDPHAAASWSNLGMMLKVEGRYDEAQEAHDRAVALEPDNPRFRVNRAVTCLKAGNWTTAWQDHEARLDLPEAPPIERARLLPALDHRSSLRGRTIIALHEQGFGDTIQFSRYLPLLARRGARVIACVPPALQRLVAAMPGVAATLTDVRSLPPHDFIVPMTSLPGIFATMPATVPPPVRPSLPAPLLARWGGRLPQEGLRVGLVWAGQARPHAPGFRTLDQRRSIGLSAFAPLADIAGVRLVSLQAGPQARQKPPLDMPLIDPMDDVADFLDTAAIIAALDVVVSVDTAVAHLAGLMDKPVFLLDRYDGCWRWLSGRRDSPWYPTLTLFRQAAPHEWASVVQNVRTALEMMALIRGAAGPHGRTLHEPACLG